MAYTGKGQIVNRTQLADITGKSLTTIDAWVRAGCPVLQRGARGVEWQFNSAAVATWREDEARKAAAGNGPSSLDEIEKRTAAAKMAKAELELAKARGDVAPVRDFERAQAKVFAEIRANVMNVAQRVVVQLLGETDETVFKTKLRAELALALEAAANADIVLADEDGGEEYAD